MGDQANEMGDNLPTVNLGTGRTAVQISAGANHSCAILDNGMLKCWGSNDSGELGLGDTIARGPSPNVDMGDNLPAVDLGTGRRAIQVVAGVFRTCALLDNRAVKCWGNNAVGQLGLGDTDHRGDQVGEMGDSLPVINLGSGRTALHIVAGGVHSCALLDNNQVKCWGANANGQLGLGDTDNRGDQGNEMGDSLPVVDLGFGRTAQQIAAGGNYTCALLDTAQVKCWGSNFAGQLGLGSADTRGDQPNEMGDNLPVVDLGTR